MMPPTSIDGTDITGATIDGTDVQEITVDGQTVFTAETLPVAYSNLVAWYPFDSSFYGGSNADDVTALFNPGQSGDSTAYDGTVNGASFQSSGGVKDINAGANSGGFDFDGLNDEITGNIGTPSLPITFMAWIKTSDAGKTTDIVGVGQGTDTGDQMGIVNDNGNLKILFFGDDLPDGFSSTIANGSFNHVAGTISDTNIQKGYINGTEVGTYTGSSDFIGNGVFGIGKHRTDKTNFFDGVIDDVRIYDTVLSQSQINQIYQNTQP